MKKKSKIILFGAGGHALSVIDVIETTKKFKILFLIDNFDGFVENYQVYKEKKNLEYYKKYTKNVFISIGHIKNPAPRIKLFKELKEKKFIFPKIISPNAYVSRRTEIGDGTIIMHHALVNSNVKIGSNCIINSKALIEHGTEIESNCHVSTASIINGDCKIKKNSFIGSNSVVIQKTKIKQNSIIGAGKIIKYSKL
jgi:sugar O-acyltransferase (sialic acid O-acetyltransferase NeuD family)